MGQKRQYTSYVLERTGSVGSYVFTVAETADSGTDARIKCAKVAADNPGKVFVACNIWPPVMAKEIKKVAFTNPDDPDGKLSDSPDIDTDEDEEVKVDPVAPIVTPVRSDPVSVATATAKVEVENHVPKPEEVVEKPPVKSKSMAKIEAAKPVPPKADTMDDLFAGTSTAKIEAAKPVPPKADTMDDLFAGTSTDDSADNQELTFANEDVIDPDESELEGDGGIPKGLF